MVARLAVTQFLKRLVGSNPIAPISASRRYGKDLHISLWRSRGSIPSS